MFFKQTFNKSLLRKAGNYLFFGALLVLVFNSGAKAWLLRQFMAVGLFKAEIKKEAQATVGAAQIPFSFRDVNGITLSTADLKGKVVFINFWATWCPPCIAEMPSLNDLYNQLQGNEQFIFLFINEDDDVAKAKSFLQNNGYTLPVMTRSGKIPAEIYSGTLPTTVVLDKEGNIVFRHEGIAKYNSTTFINQLKALL